MSPAEIKILVVDDDAAVARGTAHLLKQAIVHQYHPAQISQQVRWLGRVLAVSSLRAWLADAVHFSGRWIRAVEQTIARARELAKSA